MKTHISEEGYFQDNLEFMRQLGRERSGGVLAGAQTHATLQSALEKCANNHGHQTQCCRAASHPIAALDLIGAEVGVAACLGFVRPYPIICKAFLLTASGHGDVAKKGVT